MLKFCLFALLMFSAPAAFACSCVVDDLDAAERSEYEQADLVFNGYLIGEQLAPMTPCVPGEMDQSVAYVPRASFKVVQGDKGVEDGAIVVARLVAHPSVFYDGDCNLIEYTNSCQFSFERSHYGSKKRPIWMAFTYVGDELWANRQMCSAFSGNSGARIVAKYSKRGEQ